MQVTRAINGIQKLISCLKLITQLLRNEMALNPSAKWEEAVQFSIGRSYTTNE